MILSCRGLMSVVFGPLYHHNVGNGWVACTVTGYSWLRFFTTKSCSWWWATTVNQGELVGQSSVINLNLWACWPPWTIDNTMTTTDKTNYDEPSPPWTTMNHDEPRWSMMNHDEPWWTMITVYHFWVEVTWNEKTDGSQRSHKWPLDVNLPAAQRTQYGQFNDMKLRNSHLLRNRHICSSNWDSIKLETNKACRTGTSLR